MMINNQFSKGRETIKFIQAFLKAKDRKCSSMSTYRGYQVKIEG
ncbi:hypothetical protein SAMN05660297_03038 [Natronincola peptidivorans]|uniref:Uncharacterized protein n=1 Tax=Natronincola peptidivorans TaxID=426128 RepID=A0A1I0G4G0_9FIRM|nr:hypothetical protein SAMN05660297_03038 [Natronincola peptidivorans]